MTPAELAEIAKYATLFNQRFGQFLDNVITTQHIDDLFYITDEELVAACRRYFKLHHG